MTNPVPGASMSARRLEKRVLASWVDVDLETLQLRKK
jgi:hypothetical protein